MAETPRILIVTSRYYEHIAAELEASVGLGATGGGRHPGQGTVNRLVWLGDSYLELIGHIRLPEVCANLCFGGPKRNQLLITAAQSVYLLQVNTQGAAPG